MRDIGNPTEEKGIIQPFQRDGRSDFLAASGERLIKSRIEQILATEGTSPYSEGEIPWRTELGSQLHLIRHKNDTDINADLARIYVNDALTRWQRNIQITSVHVTHESENDAGVFIINVRYKILASGGGSDDELQHMIKI